MNEKGRLVEKIFLKKYLGNEWLLNIYILKNDKLEVISSDLYDEIIKARLIDLESSCFSDEFIYLKTGFVILHFGRRGVSVNVWHVGEWGTTCEVFCCNWYCYERKYDEFELLDSAEPSLCMHDLCIAINELENFSEIFNNRNFENDFKKKYIEVYKCYI